MVVILFIEWTTPEPSQAAGRGPTAAFRRTGGRINGLNGSAGRRLSATRAEAPASAFTPRPISEAAPRGGELRA